MQHQVQWVGSTVRWNASSDDYYVVVAIAVDPPETAAWLDANLASWLKQAFTDRDRLRVQVAPPEKRGGVPFTQIVITGLQEPFPERDALIASIDEALEAAEKQVDQRLSRAEAYEASLQVSRGG